MDKLIKLGTNYGGWILPIDCSLNEDSIIYSGGVGEDISFDILLSSKYDCNIYLIDPTKRAFSHYNECVKYFKNNYNISDSISDNDERKMFTGDIQKDYLKIIKNTTPNFNKIHYYDIGLWDKKDTLKFYKQNNHVYVSQSIISNMFGNQYDIIEVDSIKNIMNKHQHTHIDLLKLDIEGAEINVLEQMLNDNIYPHYLCIEFDLKLKNKDPTFLTNKIIHRLLHNEGYVSLIKDNFNITFERKI